MDTVTPIETAAAADALRHVRIVLVGTQHPGNIGAAARALKTMGLSRLVLVAPERYPHADAAAMAAGADDVLAGAIRVETLSAALADCRLVMGCTARDRRIALPQYTPHQAAAEAIGTASSEAEVALVFGRERTGLDNDELQLCRAAVHIPANPGYSSLNLAAAVQVLSYELRMAWLGRRSGERTGADPVVPRTEPPADHAQLEGFYAQLADTLDAIDFHKGRAPESAMRKLRRIFSRSEPDLKELRLLRGILADAQRMARLAGGRRDAD